MGKNSGIGWTDHTHNPWIGCDEVGPGCDNCYARALDWQRQWGVPQAQAAANRDAGTAPHWGIDAPRHRTSETSRRQPYAWDRAAAAAGKPAKVFSGSLCDIFDKRVPQAWRDDLWGTVRDTPNLRWILVTKRISNADSMLPASVPRNAGVVVTVCSQAEANRDVPRVLELKRTRGLTWVGLSVEPQLGRIDLTELYPRDDENALHALAGIRANSDGTASYIPGLDWVIGGGESRQRRVEPRPYDVAWARSLLGQCRAAGVAYFQKQLGGHTVGEWDPAHKITGPLRDLAWVLPQDTGAGADPADWPPDLRVQQFPQALLQ